jgi:hypothetical protein
VQTCARHFFERWQMRPFRQISRADEREFDFVFFNGRELTTIFRIGLKDSTALTASFTGYFKTTASSRFRYRS